MSSIVSSSAGSPGETRLTRAETRLLQRIRTRGMPSWAWRVCLILAWSALLVSILSFANSGRQLALLMSEGELTFRRGLVPVLEGLSLSEIYFKVITLKAACFRVGYMLATLVAAAASLTCVVSLKTVRARERLIVRLSKNTVSPVPTESPIRRRNDSRDVIGL